MSETHDQAPETQTENARLLAALETERTTRLAAERRADSYEAQLSEGGRRLATAHVNQLTAQEHAADQAISSLGQQIEALEGKEAALTAEGNFAEAAKIRTQISKAAAQQHQAEQNKIYFAGQRSQAAAQPTDPVEKWLADRSGQYNDQEQAWIRNNRRYALDPDFQNRVVQAHNEATGDLKLTRGAPEYFAHLEKRGYQRPDPAPPQPPAERPAAAPATEQAEDAPTGYTGEETEPPQIVIQEQPVAAARDSRVENPQRPAAGQGSIRAAIAAAPSHRSATSPSGRIIQIRLTPEERETALASAPHMAPDNVLQGGETAVLAWWHELKNSPNAKRIKEGWSA